MKARKTKVVNGEVYTKCDDCGNYFDNGIHLTEWDKVLCVPCGGKLIDKIKKEKGIK